MKNQTLERKFVLGGEMKTEQGETLKEIVKQYYGAGTSADQKTIDECIKNVEARGFLEECRKAVAEQENKRIHIGKLHINKVACVVVVLSIIMFVTGFTIVIKHIKSIQLVNKEDHSEVLFEYNDNPNEKTPNKIKEYYTPAWIPEGYRIISEVKSDHGYYINYESSDGRYQIAYSQTLTMVKQHFSTENGKSESVTFDIYKGEYIETGKSNYLIVTDGTYLYSIIGDVEGKDVLIKMLK